MSYRNRIVASLPLLLRGQLQQQRLGALGRSQGRPSPAPRLILPLTPCSPSRYNSSKSSQKRRSLPSNKTSSGLGDGVPAEAVPSSPAQLGRLTRATKTKSHIEVSFEHPHTVTPVQLSTLWFRDACSCDKCVSVSSGQKRFATCDIDPDPQVESCKVTDSGDLEVVWANDSLIGGSHTSTYPLDLLHQIVVLRSGLQGRWRFTPQPILWDKSRYEDDMDARFINYEDWISGGEAFAKAIMDLSTWGLIFVRGVPESHDAVQDIASKIGNLQLTFYGLTWDVISKPNAENVAYTNEFLCLHQDLLYWKETPKIQLLHCLKNECEGGESLFSDGLRTAVELKATHEEQYSVLAKEYVNYHYTRNGNFYNDQRHIIVQEESGSPSKVNWSPPFQGPFDPDFGEIGHGRLHSWREAARTFRDTLEAPANMLQYRLRPGECVLFDNQRILHGRTKFDTSAGLRHLRGGYIDMQTLASAIVRLGKEGALDEQPVSRYGSVEEENIH